MHTKAPHEQFYRYVIPAMASQLLTGFFIIVDGFFIGQSIGDVGLASINILWPIAAVILATGLGIGSGGSVVMTHAMGAGDTEKALAARGNTLLCLGAATVLLTAALGLSYPWLLRLLGATGELYQPAADYTVVVVLAGGLQIFNSGLNPLLRGSGRTVAAMAIMIFSLLCNILLDWLFIAVFAWGMHGAALATVTAQGLSALAALLCLLMNKNAPVHARQFCPDPRLCKKLLTVGVSPFGLSMSASVLIMLNNWQCIRYGGAGAVATYAILSYVLGALQPLLSGIGEGIQPLVSFCHGAGDLAAQHHLQRRALRLLLAVARCCAQAHSLLGNSCRCCLALRPRPPGKAFPPCCLPSPRCLFGAWCACTPPAFTPPGRRAAACSLFLAIRLAQAPCFCSFCRRCWA